jgi:hypothetical protein
MFNNPAKEIRISCDFRLAEAEQAYLIANADELLTETIWRILLPEAYEWGGYRMARFAAQFREREVEVRDRVRRSLPRLISEIGAGVVTGECFIPVGQTPHISDSLLLGVVFSTFRPEDIGVIDYHGAQRHYGRELVQGINLNLEASQQQRKQTALYNYAGKYANVKAEMAASYIKELLSAQAGVPREEQSTLINTLQELFRTFFPEKDFLGPQPTRSGALEFPVRTQLGNVHDLDELSSGEKEILYGYLRIRNSAPRHSIVLIDEPELHLNPRLIRGLPLFYQKNLGRALGNQIWLVSHSDALLREVVGRENYDVFHMLPCGSVPRGKSQLRPLAVTADLELALIDLVGDLAAYRPGGKVVLFEGGGDADFDRRVVASLFPELQTEANLISATNKSRVRSLHEILNKASESGDLPFRFYAITDMDTEESASNTPNVRSYAWDVYHIENYLVHEEFIQRVLSSLGMAEPPSIEIISDDLRQCARESVSLLIRHELAEYANTTLVGAISTGTDPSKEDLVGELDQAINRSSARLSEAIQNKLSKSLLIEEEARLRQKYDTSLADGSWRHVVPGRNILKRYAGRHAHSVSYEVFRNLLISKMRDQNFRPVGMNAVVSHILSD